MLYKIVGIVALLVVITEIAILLILRKSGDQGIQGEVGPDGEEGEKGKEGEKGHCGVEGERGDQGETGPKGDVGDVGDMPNSMKMIDCAIDGNKYYIGNKCHTFGLKKLIGDEIYDLSIPKRINGNSMPTTKWDKWTIAFWLKVENYSDTIRNIFHWGNNEIWYPSILLGPNGTNQWDYPRDALLLEWTNQFSNRKNNTTMIIPEPNTQNKCGRSRDALGCEKGFIPLNEWIHIAITSSGSRVSHDAPNTLETLTKVYINGFEEYSYLWKSDRNEREVMIKNGKPVKMLEEMKKQTVHIPFNDINPLLPPDQLTQTSGVKVRRMYWCDTDLPEYVIWMRLMREFN